MVQLFNFVRDKFGTSVPPAPVPRGFLARVPDADDDDDDPGGGDDGGESVAGLTVIIEYRDGKGVESLRQVSCIRIEHLRGQRYLRAFCHVRRNQRPFRIDRIMAVIDAETGEHLADGARYFADYADDRVSAAPMGWGLSVQQRAMMGAGLNVLTFLSRCDGHIHPAEIEEVETFAAGWWMRAGPATDMPHGEIYAHLRRLAPDAEAFVLSAQKVRGCATTRPLVAGYARRLIEADGRISPEEHHWIERLIAWWSEA